MKQNQEIKQLEDLYTPHELDKSVFELISDYVMSDKFMQISRTHGAATLEGRWSNFVQQLMQFLVANYESCKAASHHCLYDSITFRYREVFNTAVTEQLDSYYKKLHQQYKQVASRRKPTQANKS